MSVALLCDLHTSCTFDVAVNIAFSKGIPQCDAMRVEVNVFRSEFALEPTGTQHARLVHVLSNHSPTQTRSDVCVCYLFMVLGLQMPFV